MPPRTRTPWLALLLGLSLGAVPFLGTADASPGASQSRHTRSQQASRARPSSSSHRRPSSRSQPRRDPPVPPDDPDLTREQILATSASESIGRAAQGRLHNGVELGESDVLDVLHGSSDTSYGTSELVAMIERAAADVAERFPESRLYVGDLSKRGGGRLGSHRSHRSGRDADIGFYFVNEAGAPHPARHFVHFDGDGHGVTGWDDTEVRFDAERNWALLEALIHYDGNAELQYVFVAPRLQSLLLEEAARQGASSETIARATELMSHYSRGHDNHFHIRIHCPSGDEQCIDNEPARRRRRGRPSSSRRGSAR